MHMKSIVFNNNEEEFIDICLQRNTKNVLFVLLVEHKTVERKKKKKQIRFKTCLSLIRFNNNSYYCRYAPAKKREKIMAL